jgi:hypothetical protein
MPYKILINNNNNKTVVRHGFMAVKDRQIEKILEANFKLAKNLNNILDKHSIIPVDEPIKNTIRAML